LPPPVWAEAAEENTGTFSSRPGGSPPPLRRVPPSPRSVPRPRSSIPRRRLDTPPQVKNAPEAAGFLPQVLQGASPAFSITPSSRTPRLPLPHRGAPGESLISPNLLSEKFALAAQPRGVDPGLRRSDLRQRLWRMTLTEPRFWGDSLRDVRYTRKEVASWRPDADRKLTEEASSERSPPGVSVAEPTAVAHSPLAN
jgi:hypothetical protein